MQFTVPKFIEMETKIVGPFTFKQFIFVGIAGAILFILYFSIPFIFFLFAALIVMPIAMALAFLRIGGQPLPTILKNFFTFSTSPKLYLFRKGVLPPKLIPKKEIPKEKIEEPVLKITRKGLLQKLSAQVETRTK